MRDLIHALRFKPALGRTDGLKGYVSFEHGVHSLRGITLHRAADGRYTLSYPKHRDQFGVRHPIIRPIDQAARDDITEQVVAELRRQGRRDCGAYTRQDRNCC